MKNNISRRKFIKNTAVSSTGLALGVSAVSAKSYKRILGSNDRLGVAIIGCGRRVGAYGEAIAKKENNAELLYFCDVKKSQFEAATEKYKELIDYAPKRETDLRKVLADSNVDLIFNATPDHWHAPGTILALAEGKHVYLEKPLSHNMHESELLVAAEKKFNKIIQIGTQQRSSGHSIEIINAIHNGRIGKPYKAVAFYSNGRGAVPLQKKTPAPADLDWDLFQGPAPRRDYTEETWNYNWHWYGWSFGTAETGNNATHELDVARWALQVDYPIRVDVDAQKRHFINDGWEMYDTMDATFKYAGNKTIKWDGKSRNAYSTYGSGRGTIIYGTEGSVFVNRDGYKLFDRSGKVLKDSQSATQEAGTALGGGGGMSTLHVENFFNAIRGKAKVTAPLSDGIFSMAMVNYSNIAYRIGKGFDIDDSSGKMKDTDAMKLWARKYQPGWEPKV